MIQYYLSRPIRMSVILIVMSLTFQHSKQKGLVVEIDQHLVVVRNMEVNTRLLSSSPYCRIFLSPCLLDLLDFHLFPRLLCIVPILCCVW